jgi:hypothetical protein
MVLLFYIVMLIQNNSVVKQISGDFYIFNRLPYLEKGGMIVRHKKSGGLRLWLI